MITEKEDTKASKPLLPEEPTFNEDVAMPAPVKALLVVTLADAETRRVLARGNGK